MRVIKLPHDLGVDRASDARILFYEHSTPSLTQKVVFEQHAISLLQEGIKKVIVSEGSQTVAPQQVLLIRKGHFLMTEKTRVTLSSIAVRRFY